MTVLVDAGVLYADHDTDATRHEGEVGALDAVYDGAFGQPYVSDYRYDEVVTLALARSGSFDVAQRLGRRPEFRRRQRDALTRPADTNTPILGTRLASGTDYVDGAD